MKRFVTGQARGQATLFPERLEDFVGEDNPVRVIDAFVEQLELRELGFATVAPKAVELRPILTLVPEGFAGNFDPRLTLSCLVTSRRTRSDRRGVVKCDQALAPEGWRCHP